MFSRKFQHAVALALLFYVVSSPFTYKMIDKLIGGIVETVAPSMAYWFKVAESGCPTNYGLLVHSVFFGLVSYYLLHTSS
jgi:hypothetical protein